jgi:hypothetical protein
MSAISDLLSEKASAIESLESELNEHLASLGYEVQIVAKKGTSVHQRASNSTLVKRTNAGKKQKLYWKRLRRIMAEQSCTTAQARNIYKQKYAA